MGDWGFATSFSRKRGHVQRCGSFGFCSPELLLGGPYIGPEVDIWALGVTLFTLMEGRYPFFSRNENETFELIIDGLYITPLNWSDDLAHLISWMLTVDPSERITINQILEHPWVKSDRSTGCYSTKYLANTKIAYSPSVSVRKYRSAQNTGRVRQLLKPPSLDIIKRRNISHESIPVIPLLDFLDKKNESTKKSKLSKLSPK